MMNADCAFKIHYVNADGSFGDYLLKSRKI